MKKTATSWCVAGASLISLAAHAQTNITIFGTVDGGVRYQTNANHAGGNRFYMGTNGWNSSNKIDFAGKEELGGGLQAHFLLENGFNLATGALDNTTNTLFNRQSFVGLKGNWGSFDMGRQYTIAHDFIAEYDPFHFNYTSLIPLTQASSGTRFSNDLKYTGKFGPFKLELENAFGENAGSFNNGSARGIGLQYYAGSLTFGGSYNRRYVQAGGAFRNENYYLGGVAWKVGKLGISGGYMIDTIEMPANVANTVTRNIFGGASYAFTDRVKLTGGFYKTKVSTDAAQARSMTIVGLDYTLSKRTKLYVETDYSKYHSAVTSTLNTAGVDHQLAYTVGINHRF